VRCPGVRRNKFEVSGAARCHCSGLTHCRSLGLLSNGGSFIEQCLFSTIARQSTFASVVIMCRAAAAVISLHSVTTNIPLKANTPLLTLEQDVSVFREMFGR